MFGETFHLVTYLPKADVSSILDFDYNILTVKVSYIVYIVLSVKVGALINLCTIGQGY